MEVGEEGDYMPIATLSSTRITPALRWAAMSEPFQCLIDGVHKPEPSRREGRAEAESSRGPSAYQPNTLPLGQTSSQEHDSK